MTEDATNQEPNQEPPTRTSTPRRSRYELAYKCRDDYAQYQRGVMAQRLRGSRRRIGEAIDFALAILPNGLQGDGQCERLIAALASVGVTVQALGATACPARSDVRVSVDPALLRKSYPRLPRKEPHTFACSFALNECEGEDALAPSEARSETRYHGGLSEQDELRMQVEILRQPLADLGVTIDKALDELCAGLQSPCEQTTAWCDAIAVALERYGLRFHAVRKSWRLPRAGVLLIERPEDLTRACPSLTFFEPQEFRHLLIVDRPERAGREVRQGLLF
jgi:hypothetical protein